MPNRNFPCSSFLISLWQTFNHPRNLNALTVVIIRIPSVSTLFQYADFRVAQPEEEDGGGGGRSILISISTMASMERQAPSTCRKLGKIFGSYRSPPPPQCCVLSSTNTYMERRRAIICLTRCLTAVLLSHWPRKGCQLNNPRAQETKTEDPNKKYGNEYSS